MGGGLRLRRARKAARKVVADEDAADKVIDQWKKGPSQPISQFRPQTLPRPVKHHPQVALGYPQSVADLMVGPLLDSVELEHLGDAPETLRFRFWGCGRRNLPVQVVAIPGPECSLDFMT